MGVGHSRPMDLIYKKKLTHLNKILNKNGLFWTFEVKKNLIFYFVYKLKHVNQKAFSYVSFKVS